MHNSKRSWSLHILLIAICLPLTMWVMNRTWDIYGSNAYFSNDSIIFENGSGFRETSMADTDCEDPTTETWVFQVVGEMQLADGTIVDEELNGTALNYIGTTFRGAILPFAGPAPPGWLLCDGSTYAIGPNTNCSYRDLFAIMANGGTPLWGTSITSGSSKSDYTGTLKVPDLRGYFIRGSDYAPTGNANRDETFGGRLSDPNFADGNTITLNDSSTVETYHFANEGSGLSLPNVGTYQEHTYSAHYAHKITIADPIYISTDDVIHSHTFSATSTSGPIDDIETRWEDDGWILFPVTLKAINGLVKMAGSEGYSTNATTTSHTHTVNLGFDTIFREAKETRPKNAAVYYYIKY